MKCKFVETKKCIHAELFEEWKDNKKESAWLMLGICPNCPIYRADIDGGEVKEKEARARE